MNGRDKDAWSYIFSTSLLHAPEMFTHFQYLFQVHHRSGSKECSREGGGGGGGRATAKFPTGPSGTSSFTLNIYKFSQR